jgi:DNA-binding NtrC family response regulator
MEKKKKILIAEDEFNIRRTWQMLLEKEGFDVHTCRKGFDAREEIKKWRPDLVLLDLSMPTTGRDEGFRVLADMSKRKRNIPVIICTGVYRRDEVQEKVKEKGYENVVKILEKPISNQDLLSSINDVISTCNLSGSL